MPREQKGCPAPLLLFPCSFFSFPDPPGTEKAGCWHLRLRLWRVAKVAGAASQAVAGIQSYQ